MFSHCGKRVCPMPKPENSFDHKTCSPLRDRCQGKVFLRQALLSERACKALALVKERRISGENNNANDDNS